jgi:hypothetical protein
MTEQEAMQILADMGLHEGGMDNWVPDNAWYRFANVVEAKARADEREECAALCFSIWNKWLDTPEEDRYKVLYDAEDCAAAIRARGTT